MHKKIIIYTDGACKGNPGKGGWAALLKYKNVVKEIYGGTLYTTNNRMELTAVIQGLSILKDKNCKIELFTDSKYVQNGMNIWLNNWIKRGWTSSNKKVIKNQDLWKIINQIQQKHEIIWNWVKGHDNDALNNHADKLANKGLLKQTITINNFLTE